MTILIFLYGLFIGSFLNVCIYRRPRNKSLLFIPVVILIIVQA
ncbi:prepilin peptidase [Tissierella carlieri]|uniref:Prepilin peptidase n=1 Tax=Tissierella carlieri TaxID=689904 RepID=A0ABT1S553_9FIRM|nr:prepilin peptidase [Tissierella carlieri]MCQ4921601.1 prepilin peptidase [Tissierella carlieri]